MKANIIKTIDLDSRFLQLMQMGLIFHDKNKKGIQINSLFYKKNQTEQIIKAPVLLLRSREYILCAIMLQNLYFKYIKDYKAWQND